MSWYLLADGNLYKAERTINAPGWSLDENTPRDQPVHGWTWYEDDDTAMLATGLAVSITARLDRIDPPRTPEEQVEYEALRATIRYIITDLRAEKDRAQTVINALNADINKSPASYIKDTARAAKRIADAAIDLARFVAP